LIVSVFDESYEQFKKASAGDMQISYFPSELQYRCRFGNYTITTNIKRMQVFVFYPLSAGILEVWS